MADVPEFLAPERTGPLDEILAVVRTTPAKRLNEELAAVGAGHPSTPWAGDLAMGKAEAVRHSRCLLAAAALLATAGAISLATTRHRPL
ncbi:hypothetical protein [Jiangella gansuensis]|uniref:hypothetical protein n=1 Tax=Jiangella gansuensis TaxID=281473 RepID=UPI00047B1C56|nr:hypothetical protein [Jiangella gansuensis]